MDKLVITVDPCSSMSGPAQIRIEVSTSKELEILLKLEKLIDENIIQSNKFISKKHHANHTIVVWNFNGDIKNLIDIINQKRLEVTNELIRQLR